MQPITATREAAPRGGLAGAVGLGVALGPNPDPLDPGGDWQRDTYKLEGPACRASYVRGDECGVVDLPEEGVSLLQSGPESHPFTVEAAVHCSTFGSMPPDPAEWQPVTDRLLEMCQWSEIGHELWTGAKARSKGWANRFLASVDAVVAVEGVGWRDAISALEDRMSICTCGGVHVIHVPVAAVALMDSPGLLYREGDRLFTANGSLIVADAGYTGSGPGDVPATNESLWIYATPPLTARLAPIFHAQAETRSMVQFATNDIRYRSERRAAISWLCCHFAANVSTC